MIKIASEPLLQYSPCSLDPWMAATYRRINMKALARYQIILLGEQRHIGDSNFPRVVAWRCASRESKPRPSNCQSNTLTTIPPILWGKGKSRYSSSWESHLRATGCHLPYGITQCYLTPDTSEHTPPNPSHTGWYSINLPQRMEGWVDLVDLIAT